jgi:serine/threonine protein phosphatase PrpC
MAKGITPERYERPTLELGVGRHTIASPAHPEVNEDKVGSVGNVFYIIDGASKGNGAENSVAVEEAFQAYYSPNNRQNRSIDAETRIIDAFRYARATLQTQGVEGYSAGILLEVTDIGNDEYEVISGHLGDCELRVYDPGIEDPEPSLRAVTLNHSPLVEQLGEERARALQEYFSKIEDPKKLSRYMFEMYLECSKLAKDISYDRTDAPTINRFRIKKGQALILLTDGVSDLLPTEMMTQALMLGGTAQQVSERLTINAANANTDKTHPRDKDDDRTAQVIIGGLNTLPNLTSKINRSIGFLRNIGGLRRELPERGLSVIDLFRQLDEQIIFEGNNSFQTAAEVKRLFPGILYDGDPIDQLPNTNNLREKARKLQQASISTRAALEKDVKIFDGLKDLQDILDTIFLAGPIPSTDGISQDAAYIKTTIEQIRQDPKLINTITSKAGLRDAVKRYLRIK